MQYLALIYADETAWATFSEEERQAAYQEYFRFGDEGRKAGVVVDGNELDATSTARIPGASHGTVEVRPVYVDGGEGS